MGLFWELWQTRKINEARAKVLDVNDRVTHGQALDESMSQRLDRLTLITASLWEIVKTQSLLDDDTLKATMEELDLRDGKRDGKITVKGGTACPSCGRVTGRKHDKCIYCGETFSLPPIR